MSLVNWKNNSFMRKFNLFISLSFLFIFVFCASCSKKNLKAEKGPFSLQLEYNLTCNDEMRTLFDTTYIVVSSTLASQTEPEILEWGTKSKQIKKQINLNCPDTLAALMVNNIIEDYKGKDKISVKLDYKISLNVLDKDGKITDSFKEENSINKQIIVSDEELADFMPNFLWSINSDGKLNKISLSDVAVDTTLEPEYEEPKLESVQMDNTLYYLSESLLENNDKSILDNISSHFPNRMKWDGITPLTYCDFLMLNENDINQISSELLEKCIDNDAIIIFKESPKNLSKMLVDFDEYDPLENIGESEDLSSPQTIIFSGDLKKANSSGIYMMLPSYADENFDEIDQEGLVNFSLNEIQKILNPQSNDISTKADSNIINKIVGAYNLYFSCSHIIFGSDYRDRKQLKLQEYDRLINNYMLHIAIWNAYSYKEHKNYYHIHQELIAPFHKTYKGIYKKSVKGHAKVCEWYGDWVTITNTNQGGNDWELLYTSPSTTVVNTTLTSGVSFNISGNAALKFEGGKVSPTLGIAAGASFSSSQTTTIADVTVSNLAENQQAAWKFDIKGPYAKYKFFEYAWAVLKEGALVGRTTLTAPTDFIVSYDDNIIPKIQTVLKVNLHSAVAKVGNIIDRYGRNNSCESYHEYSLPVITRKDAESIIPEEEE